MSEDSKPTEMPPTTPAEGLPSSPSVSSDSTEGVHPSARGSVTDSEPAAVPVNDSTASTARSEIPADEHHPLENSDPAVDPTGAESEMAEHAPLADLDAAATDRPTPELVEETAHQPVEQPESSEVPSAEAVTTPEVLSAATVKGSDELSGGPGQESTFEPEPAAPPARPQPTTSGEVPSVATDEGDLHAVTDEAATAPSASASPAPAKRARRTRKDKAAAPRAETDQPAVPPAPLQAETSTNGGTTAEPTTETAEPSVEEQPGESQKKWYAIKVQSGREESIKAAIERRIRIDGLEKYFGQIVIPVEEVNEKRKVKVRVKNKATGEIETHTQERNVVKKVKKYPGYIFAEVEFNDSILYVFRETTGVGDFVGMKTRRTSGGGFERSPPIPMTDREVQAILTGVPGVDRGKTGRPMKTVVKLDFDKGDKVRIKSGAFAGQEGEVKAIHEAKDPGDTPKVTVEVTFWGRPVPVELDYWEVDKV